VDVLATKPSARASKEYANWPTIPQLYIKGEFVGGSDIMREMFESGELKKLLDEAWPELAG
jgi:monothiol glutaredoxin